MDLTLYREVQRIIAGGRPASREERLAWIAETAECFEIWPVVRAFMRSHLDGANDIAELDDAQVARLQRYVKATVDVEVASGGRS